MIESDQNVMPRMQINRKFHFDLQKRKKKYLHTGRIMKVSIKVICLP